MSAISIAVPVYTTILYNSSICLLYAVTNLTTNNTLIRELVVGEKYMLYIYSVYARLM
jgi:hypothetical protein